MSKKAIDLFVNLIYDWANPLRAMMCDILGHSRGINSNNKGTTVKAVDRANAY